MRERPRVGARPAHARRGSRAGPQAHHYYYYYYYYYYYHSPTTTTTTSNYTNNDTTNNHNTTTTNNDNDNDNNNDNNTNNKPTIGGSLSQAQHDRLQRGDHRLREVRPVGAGYIILYITITMPNYHC